jgi:hypothetical protein
MRNLLSRRAVRLTLASVLAIAGLTAISATPAMADSTCPTAAACVWTSASFTGTKTVINGTPCVNIIPDNNATSLKVNASPASNDWIFYIGYNCDPGQGFTTYSNGTSISQLSAAVDNKYSSAGPA